MKGYNNLKEVEDVVFKNSFIYYAVAFMWLYLYVVWSFRFSEDSEFLADLLIYS